MPDMNDKPDEAIPFLKRKDDPIWGQLNPGEDGQDAVWIWKRAEVPHINADKEDEVPIPRPRKLGEKKAKPAALRDKDADDFLVGELGQGEPIFFKPYSYSVGADPYGIIPPQLTKDQEEESNLIRIDLEQAAKALAKDNWKEDLYELKEDSEEFLALYDRFYDILFKSKS